MNLKWDPLRFSKLAASSISSSMFAIVSGASSPFSYIPSSSYPLPRNKAFISSFRNFFFWAVMFAEDNLDFAKETPGN